MIREAPPAWLIRFMVSRRAESSLIKINGLLSGGGVPTINCLQTSLGRNKLIEKYNK